MLNRLAFFIESDKFRDEESRGILAVHIISLSKSQCK